MYDSNETPDYLRMILTRTRNDRQLAFAICSQLFAEMPEQLVSIQNALTGRRFDLAQQVTHKLHGSLSFSGFENIRKQAEHLECCLVNKNYGAISRYWFQLQQCALDFTAQQQTLLSDLSGDNVQGD